MDDFKIYEDKELANLLESPILLGKLKAGNTKQYKFYVYNSSVKPYEEMIISVDDPEITVISSPTEMDEKSSTEIILEWKPSVDIKRGLKTSIKIEGYEVIG